MSIFKGKAAAGYAGEAFEIPPQGHRPAVLVACIDLGTQERIFEGESSEVHQLMLCWELTSSPMSGHSDGRNHVIGRIFTLSFAPTANLRIMLESWRGGKKYVDGVDEVDLTKLLGRSCMVKVNHTPAKNKPDRIYADVADVSEPIEGMRVPPAKRKPFLWQIGEHGIFPDHDWLPYYYGKPLKTIVERSPEYQAWLSQQGGATRPAASPATAEPAQGYTEPPAEEIPF